MAITEESKAAIKKRINELYTQRRPLIERKEKMRKEHEKLKDSLNTINAMIVKLEGDLSV